MGLKKEIQGDLKRFIKESQKLGLSVLRMLLASIVNKEKEKRYQISKRNPGISAEDLEKESQLTDEEIIEVLGSEIKKRKESILAYQKGEKLQPSLSSIRKKYILDLAEKEKKEIEILSKYLPEQLSEEEIEKLVQEAIKKVKAKEQKDIGRVMAELMPGIKGRVEGGTVSKIVKKLLEKG